MAEPGSQESVFARCPEVVSADVSGEIILLDSRTWSYLDFDEIGSRIWVLLEEPLTLSALVEKLVQEFDVDPGACRHDTGIFLRQLIEKGVVIAREASMAAG